MHTILTVALAVSLFLVLAAAAWLLVDAFRRP